MVQKKSSKKIEKKSPVAAKKGLAPAKGTKPAAKKPAAKPVLAKKPAAKPVPAKKPAVSKPAAKAKPLAKKPVAKKPVAKKTPPKAAPKVVAKVPRVEPAPAKSAKGAKTAPVASGPASSKDMVRFRSLLNAKRRELLEDLTQNHEANIENSEEGIQDIADKATSSYTREFLYSLSEGDRRQLQLIDEALFRMENGSFGVCVACNGPVNRPRLEAVPWARHCIACQELQERGLL